MFEPMTLDAFAEFTKVPAAEIERYRAAGLLDPEGDGKYEPADVLRLHVVRARLGAGQALDELARDLRSTDHPVGRRLFCTSERRYTIDEVVAETGIDPDRIQAMRAALGMPADKLYDEDDLRSVGGPMVSLMPWEALIEGARVYADGLRRLAEAGSHITHRYLCEPLAKAGVPDTEIVWGLGNVFETVTASITAQVHHMWSDYLLQASIDHAVLHLLEKDPGASPGTIDTTIVFADLALSSSIADLEGDEAAFAIIDRTDRAVRELALAHGGKLVKQIGDEFMLTFADPASAVRFALDLDDRLAGAEARHVAVRVGIHSGRVLFRLGDYYGQAVNVAARIVSMAMPHAILVTEPLAKAAAIEGIDVEEIGVRSLRGMEEPLALYRVVTDVAAR